MALIIEDQAYLYLETVVKNSESKDVHYIVKQTPFNIRFGLQGRTSLNFKTCALSCTLLYDLPARKPVDAIGGKPLDYVCHPSLDGKSCVVEFRVKVLTTQHQNNLFVINVVLEGSNGDRLAVDTHPIKSVSKPEQIRRKLSMQNIGEDEQPVSSKKRARGEEVLSTLEALRIGQQQQTELIMLLLHQQQAAVGPSAYSSPIPSVTEALAVLVRAVEAESPSERPLKIRKTAMSFPRKDQLILEEISKSLGQLLPQPPATRAPPPTQPPLTDSFGFNSFPSPAFPFLADFGVDPSSLSGSDLNMLGENLSEWLTQDQ